MKLIKNLQGEDENFKRGCGSNSGLTDIAESHSMRPEQGGNAELKQPPPVFHGDRVYYI